MPIKTLLERDYGGNRIRGVGAPTSDTDAATKAYVDAVAQGLSTKDAVRAATTPEGGNLNLTGTPTVDGVALVAGDRILVKNQTDPALNGIYAVAAGGWSRTADADSGGDVRGMYVFVEEGTKNADTGWVLNTDGPINVGTTALNFAQFSGAGAVIAGAGLTRSGTTLDVGEGPGIDIAADTVGLDVPVLVEHGGTGAVTAAGARTNLGIPRVYDALIGNGALTVIPVDHNLGTTVVLVEVWEEATGDTVECRVRRASANRVEIEVSAAPAIDSLHVMVVSKT